MCSTKVSAIARPVSGANRSRWDFEGTETNTSPVNAAAKQHNRVVYSSQAIHHVASQIANLYWTSVNQEAQGRSSFSKSFEKTASLSKHA